MSKMGSFFKSKFQKVKNFVEGNDTNAETLRTTKDVAEIQRINNQMSKKYQQDQLNQSKKNKNFL